MAPPTRKSPLQAIVYGLQRCTCNCKHYSTLPINPMSLIKLEHIVTLSRRPSSIAQLIDMPIKSVLMSSGCRPYNFFNNHFTQHFSFPLSHSGCSFHRVISCPIHKWNSCNTKTECDFLFKILGFWGIHPW